MVFYDAKDHLPQTNILSFAVQETSSCTLTRRNRSGQRNNQK